MPLAAAGAIALALLVSSCSGGASETDAGGADMAVPAAMDGEVVDEGAPEAPSGDAEVDRSDAPAANQVPEYLAKYAPGIARLGLTVEQFAQAYSVPIRVRPISLRGH